MSGARQVALELLHQTVREGAYPNLLFEEITGGLEDRDKRFVTLLVTDTLANLIHIDYIIDQFVGKQRIKPIIRDILRLGVDQLKFLKLEPYAVIDESVELTRERKKNQLTGFVNGVLRNIDRCERVEYPKKDTLEYFSVVYSKPLWLLKLWERDYGRQKAIAFARPRQVPTVVRRNLHRNFDLKNWLEEQGFAYQEVFAGCCRLDNSFGLHRATAFAAGDISIQGLGSQFACYALGGQGEILDACAAPGGKTLLLAEMGGRMTACDLHQHRLKLIAAQLKRGGQQAELRQQDMTVLNEEWIGAFDGVLVDAPCSGLGMLNAKPDILLNRTKEDITTLAGIQKKILANCSEYVKSGGALVYSTCTLNRTENDDVVDWFLKEHKAFALEAFALPDGRKADGALQMTPDVDGEGFYIARMGKA